nr:MAG TPA: hypothetical protein [Caudoviricetes sp.]
MKVKKSILFYKLLPFCKKIFCAENIFHLCFSCESLLE